MSPWSAAPATRKEAVLRQLRDEIVNGDLPPGTVLKDAEVAARMGLSITPVREAIAQLSAEGLVDIAPNRARRVTHVTQKNALDLIDVMAVLACAGFEWGMPHLTSSQLTTMRRQYREFAEQLRLGNTIAAAAAGASFSTTIILASGNRELVTHVDLVLPRALRVQALTSQNAMWAIWLEGYRQCLEHLEAGNKPAALARYRQIYLDYRRGVQNLAFQ